ncbi:MAG: hypothetical protein ACLP0J_22230 [Solirubrobacteraceae bacterium]
MTTLTPPSVHNRRRDTPRPAPLSHGDHDAQPLREWIALRAFASPFLSLLPATEKLGPFRPRPARLSAASGPLEAGR